MSANKLTIPRQTIKRMAEERFSAAEGSVELVMLHHNEFVDVR
jgi:hypothetical protein